MKIFVKVKARSKENKIEEPIETLFKDYGPSYYKIYVKEEPVNGKANDAVIKVLSEYFKVSRSSVRLICGAISKTKVFEILN